MLVQDNIVDITHYVLIICKWHVVHVKIIETNSKAPSISRKSVESSFQLTVDPHDLWRHEMGRALLAHHQGAFNLRCQSEVNYF